MGTTISIIILVLCIYSASVLVLYQHINKSATVQTINNNYIPTFSNFLVKVKKFKVNYAVLFWHYGNEFEHCQ